MRNYKVCVAWENDLQTLCRSGHTTQSSGRVPFKSGTIITNPLHLRLNNGAHKQLIKFTAVEQRVSLDHEVKKGSYDD
jgi:hypothetical protein